MGVFCWCCYFVRVFRGRSRNAIEVGAKTFRSSLLWFFASLSFRRPDEPPSSAGDGRHKRTASIFSSPQNETNAPTQPVLHSALRQRSQGEKLVPPRDCQKMGLPAGRVLAMAENSEEERSGKGNDQQTFARRFGGGLRVVLGLFWLAKNRPERRERARPKALSASPGWLD